MKKLILVLLSLLLVFSPLVADSARYGTTVITTETGDPIAVTTEDGDRVVAIDNTTYLIQEGDVWSLEVAIPTVADASTFYLVFDARSMTKPLRSFPTSWATTNSYAVVTLGTATSFTGGTDLSPNIFNRKSGADSREVEIYWNASITGGSFSTYPTLFSGSVGTNQQAGGGAFLSNLPVILDNDTLYVFKVETPTGDDIEYLKIHIDWAELD